MATPSSASVRRVVVRVVVAAFSVAALLGIAALVRPGRFGSTEARVLLTTLVVGVGSVLMLCYLAPSGARSRLVAAAGALADLVGAGSAMVMVWAFWHGDPGRPLTRTFGLSTVVAVTVAQCSLLLATAGARPSLARLLRATIGTASLLGALVGAAILGWDPGTTGARWVGVVAILDVLGTVVTLALGIFGRDQGSLSVRLSPATATRLREESRATGRPVAELVDEAVAAHLGSSSARRLS